MDRAQTLLVLTFAVVVVLSVVPAAAQLGATDASRPGAVQDDPNPDGGDEGTPWLARGTGGKANQGREDDEKQQFPGNTSFRIDDHAPGVTGNSFNIFAVGFSENINMHWNVVRQADFRWDTCTSTDATAFGIDRGNNRPGTETDRSLLNAYKSVTYTEGGIYVTFFKSEGIAGGPVNITVEDQIVSRVTDCLENPDEPGWYRLTGYINGSTRMDTRTDYAIYGAARYVYVCEGCDSRQEAIEALGPPPTTCPPTDEFGRDSKEWTCRTRDGEYYNRSDPPSQGSPTPAGTPTPTPPPGATPTPTPTPGGTTADTSTPTATATRTPTATPTSGGPSNPAADTPTATPTPAPDTADEDDSGGQGPSDGTDTATSATRGTAADGGTATDSEAVTPTAGAGPGLGLVAALAGVGLTALLVALGRD
jgi:hypothetical protein